MKGLVFLAVAVALASPLPLAAQIAGQGAGGTTSIAPEAYGVDEFPQWSLDIRRAEIVAFGALPFTMFFSVFAIDSYRFATHQWNTAYAPWPLKSAGAVVMTEAESLRAFAAGSIAAVAVAALDWIFVRFKRAAAEKAAAKSKPSVVVDINPWPPDDGALDDEP